MGTQGEIFVVIGKKFPVTEKEWDKNLPMYELNGKTISLSEHIPRESYDFINGFVCVPSPLNMENPALGFSVLGAGPVDWSLGYWRPGLEDNLKVLVGYAIANESYAGSATPLPNLRDAEQLRTRLVQDISSKLELEVKPEELEYFLLFESSQ